MVSLVCLQGDPDGVIVELAPDQVVERLESRRGGELVALPSRRDGIERTIYVRGPLVSYVGPYVRGQDDE